MRYAIWNNKGGVGKTFLAFILGSEYALAHPEKNVILVDMCPQANLSEIILGGNGAGNENLEELIGAERTVGGYFYKRIEQGPHDLTGDETSYLVNAKDKNENLPENLWLLCGDPKLEILAQVISQIGAQTLPLGAWKNVHSWLLNLITACSKKLGSENTQVFIDCNPSFSAYTELAMLASERLIVPCTCDGASARAIDNVASLLYGHNTRKQDINFAARAEDNGLSLPLIHTVILNRSTLYNKDASKAFSAIYAAIRKRVERFESSAARRFTSLKSSGSGEGRFTLMPDSHSVAIVCSHKGLPLQKVTPGRYEVYDTCPQVNTEPLERYKKALENIMQGL